MRAVSGQTVSARPISLSTASKILAKFVTVDNGASPAICVYLRKASDAFDELVQFHKGLKSSRSDRRSRKASNLAESDNGRHREVGADDADSNQRKRRGKKVEDAVDGGYGVVEANTDSRRRTAEQELANGDRESEKRKHRSEERKVKDEVDSVAENTIENGEGGNGKDRNIDEAETRQGKKKRKKDKKKKGGDGSISIGDNGFAEEGEDSKKRFGSAEEDRRRGQKRKIKGTEGGMEEDSSVEHRHKKNKRK